MITETVGYTVEIVTDAANKRIRVIEYEGHDISGLTDHLDKVAQENSLDKVILIARENDMVEFVSKGWVIEGVFNNYFAGRPGFFLARFFSSKRRKSNRMNEEDEILMGVFRKPPKRAKGVLPLGFTIRAAVPRDVAGLIKLYSGVFPCYPTPLNDPVYLETVMKRNNYFKLIEYHGEIVSSASAETGLPNRVAEITDCATAAEYRGCGLVSILVAELEKDMREAGMKTLFSLARALSPGMNLVFFREDYAYGGRLVNNCRIMEGFEDMNVWVKPI